MTEKEERTANSTFALWQVSANMNSRAINKRWWGKDSIVFQIRHCAKPQNVRKITQTLNG